MEGRVFKSTGSWYKVQTEDGLMLECRLKGKFKISKTGVTNPLAVGDRVLVELEQGQEGQGIITDIRERDNYLIRKSVHKSNHAHILASNIDQLVVIASLVLPRTSLGFIDRLLVSAEAFHIPARVIFNKVDLLQEEEMKYAQVLVDMYSSIGYPAMLTSVPEKLHLDDFRALLHGKTSLLAGHSGVGKSTMVNTIAPNLQLHTQEISSFANKGKHTTTYAEMFELEKGTYIIDTPGIKELGLVEMENDHLSGYFPEMSPFAAKCKFYNCTHQHEPGCAVLAGLDKGKLPLTRYQSYLSMLDDDDNRR